MKRARKRRGRGRPPKPPTEKFVDVRIKVEPALRARLEHVAEASGESWSDTVRRTLELGLAALV